MPVHVVDDLIVRRLNRLILADLYESCLNATKQQTKFCIGVRWSTALTPFPLNDAMYILQTGQWIITA